MEDRSRSLNIVLNELLEEGYVMDFEVLDKIDSRSGDFVIDGVYQCREAETLTDSVCVFAVSSEKLHIKVVAITAIHILETNYYVVEIFTKMRSGIYKFLKHFRKFFE